VAHVQSLQMYDYYYELRLTLLVVEILLGAVGIELKAALKTCKLFIHLNAKAPNTPESPNSGTRGVHGDGANESAKRFAGDIEASVGESLPDYLSCLFS
jgi:hypothetical protein